MALITVPSDFKTISSLEGLGYEKIIKFPGEHAVGQYNTRYFVLGHAAAVYSARTLCCIPLLALIFLPLSENILCCSISPSCYLSLWEMGHSAGESVMIMLLRAAVLSMSMNAAAAVASHNILSGRKSRAV